MYRVRVNSMSKLCYVDGGGYKRHLSPQTTISELSGLHLFDVTNTLKLPRNRLLGFLRLVSFDSAGVEPGNSLQE